MEFDQVGDNANTLNEKNERDVHYERLKKRVEDGDLRLQKNSKGSMFRILLVGYFEELSDFIDFLCDNMEEYTQDPLKEEPFSLKGYLLLGSKKIYHIEVVHQFPEVWFKTTNGYLEGKISPIPASAKYDGIVIYWRKEEKFKDIIPFNDYTRIWKAGLAKHIAFFDPEEVDIASFTNIWSRDGDYYWKDKMRSFLKNAQSYFDEQSAALTT